MAEEIDVATVEPIREADTFSADEMRKFEAAWRGIVRFYNRTGTIKRFDDVKSALLSLVKDAKRRLGGAEFQGSAPVQGFGMQPLTPYDMSTNATDTWDAAWTGVPASGWLLWLGNGAIGATVPANPSIVPRSANDDTWQIAHWGVISSEEDPLLQAIRPLMEKKEIGDIRIESQLRDSEEGYADLGKIMYTSGNPLHSYGVLGQMRQVTVGTDRYVPVGVVLGSARRLFQTGTAVRQVATAA